MLLQLLLQIAASSICFSAIRCLLSTHIFYFLVYRIRPHLSTSSTLAHTPSILTSPVPETPAKRPIYRSNFCLMRVAVKPAIPCAATASSHCRQGFPRLEGLRCRHHLPAGNVQGAARQYRSVPQCRPPYAGGTAANSGVSYQRGLHRAAHQPADPDGGLHHRPHGAAIPGGDDIPSKSNINAAPVFRSSASITSPMDHAAYDP